MRNRAQHKGSGGKSQPGGKVRIIAGRWRGRRLPVADVPGLRPSGDRARETLFNWLQSQLPGARCLDLFAGTGILGFEAVSRGAASATLVERNRRALAALAAAAEALNAGSAIEIVAGDALEWLQGASARYDLIFVDPPFDAGLWEEVVEALAPRLRRRGLIYLECPAGLELTLPPELICRRRKRLARVELRLLARTDFAVGCG